MAEKFHLNWGTVIHPYAFVDPSVEVGPGTVVFAGAMVQPECKIGAHSIINTAATVDHNCILEDYVQVAPGANLCGNVTVGMGTFVGANAVVLENLTLGRYSIVGGGAVVIRDLASQVVAVGCPARVIKTVKITEEQIETRRSTVRSAAAAVLQRVLADSGREVRPIRDQDTLSEALELDSLDLAVTVVGLEQELGVDPFRDGASPVRTFGELVALYEEAFERRSA
jgi:UDP-3-O-[3-hydroxymyristoyl] glucosamine N-acyltransferase